jgi:hypothetical protein
VGIARREGCSVRTVCRIVADTLARLEIDPTAGYAQPQIARLDGARKRRKGPYVYQAAANTAFFTERGRAIEWKKAFGVPVTL